MTDESEVVTRDTHPLPYVQVGMWLIHPDDSATWWEVEGITERDGVMVATVRSCDARRLDGVSCADIRARWRLYEDFDPAISMEAL